MVCRYFSSSEYLYWPSGGIYEFFDFGLVKVDRELALQGRVTKCQVNRQHFNWSLNNESTRYDFWSFEPADPATRQLITTDSLKFMADVRGGFLFYNTLAYYLRTGARLRKAANSPYITVEQNHQITRWKYRR